MSWKSFNVLSLSTLSGSGDLLRTAVGGYWNYFSESDGSGYSFVEMDGESPTDERISLVDANMDFLYTHPTTFPAYRIPIRIQGNEEFIHTDKHWKNFIRGGTFGTMSFDGVYTDEVHDSYHMNLKIPYSKYEANILEYTSEIGTTLSTTQCTYEYNHYYPEYENKTSVSSMKLIPNMYLIQAYQNSDDEVGEIPDRYMIDGIKEFVNREGTVSDEDLAALTNATHQFITMPPPDSSTTLYWGSTAMPGWLDTNLKLRNYLTGAYVQTNLSSSTRDKIDTILSNIYHDEHFYDTLYEDIDYAFDSGYLRRNSFPFYIKINFDIPEGFGRNARGHIEFNPGTALAEGAAGVSTELIKSLKEAFDNSSPYIFDSQAYAVESLYYTGSIENRLTSEVKAVTDTSYRSIDYKKLLISMLDSGRHTHKDCFFMGTDKITTDSADRLDRLAAMDLDNSYAYVSSTDSHKLLNGVAARLSSSWDSESLTFDLQALYNRASGGTLDIDFNGETIAYRIEKTTLQPVGPTEVRNPVQNFWFYNSIPLDGTEFRFYDSQVSYSTPYTYTIFAYVLGSGIKYRFTDLKTTRQIASGSIGEGDDALKYYCLEFQDLLGNTSDQLYYASDTDSMVYTEEAAAALSDESIDNEFLTGSASHIISTSPYIADMYLHYEPTLRVFEIPIYSKTLRVMDHPPNKLEISPYQLMDNSQRIGFSFLKDTFVKAKFPTPISYEDTLARQEYLHANDIIDEIEMMVENKQVSKTKFIEVYRIDTKPEAISDFNQYLLDTIDLTLAEDIKQTRPTHNFHDTIKTNKKYYYLFRGLNEHGESGFLSDIYEVELIDDGGYKYAVFNVFRESDLEIDTHTETVKSCRMCLILH